MTSLYNFDVGIEEWSPNGLYARMNRLMSPLPPPEPPPQEPDPVTAMEQFDLGMQPEPYAPLNAGLPPADATSTASAAPLEAGWEPLPYTPPDQTVAPTLEPPGYEPVQPGYISPAVAEPFTGYVEPLPSPDILPPEPSTGGGLLGGIQNFLGGAADFITPDYITGGGGPAPFTYGGAIEPLPGLADASQALGDVGEFTGSVIDPLGLSGDIAPSVGRFAGEAVIPTTPVELGLAPILGFVPGVDDIVRRGAMGALAAPGRMFPAGGGGPDDIPHPGSLFGYTPPKAPNFGTPERVAYEAARGRGPAANLQGLTSVRGTMPRYGEMTGLQLDATGFDPNLDASLAAAQARLTELPQTGSRQAAVNREIGRLEAQLTVRNLMQEGDAGTTLDRIADIIEDRTDAFRSVPRKPRDIAFEQELNRIWDEPATVPMETAPSPYVQRPDLFGNVQNTFQTEGELAGIRPEQGTLLNAPRAAAAIPEGQVSLLQQQAPGGVSAGPVGETTGAPPAAVPGPATRIDTAIDNYRLMIAEDEQLIAATPDIDPSFLRNHEEHKIALARLEEARAQGGDLRDIQSPLSPRQQERMAEAYFRTTGERLGIGPTPPAAPPGPGGGTTAGVVSPPPPGPPAPPTRPPGSGGGMGGEYVPPGPPEDWAGNIRLEKFPEEVQPVIKEWADANPEAVQEARRGVRPDAQVMDDARALAEEAGGSFERLQRSWKPGDAWNAEEITAVRGVLRTKAQDTLAAARLAAVDDSAVNQARLVLAMQEQIAVQNVVHGVTAEAGRALRSFRQMASELEAVAAQGDAEAMQQVLQKAGAQAGLTRTGIDEVARRINSFNPNSVAVADLPAVQQKRLNKYVRSTTKPNFWDYAHAWYINSILSGPMTHLRNAASNIGMAALSPVERGLAAGVENVLAPLQGRQAERFFSEVPADVVGAVHGVIPGLKAGLETLKTGVSPTQMSKWDQVKRIPSGPLGVNRAWTLPTTALEAADAVNYGVNYSSSLYAGANRMARTEGLRGQALIRRMDELINDPPADLVAQADKNAEYRLFRAPPGTWTQAILNARNTIRPLQFILPFVRTPANLVKMGIERSPAAFLNFGEQGVWRNLAAKSPEASDQIGRAMLGSAIATALAAGYATGEIDLTTAAPDYRDSAARDRFFREGKLPYAVKIPGIGWVQYRQMEPLNQTFAQMATVMQAIKNGEDPSKAATDMLGTVIDMLSEQTYISGLNDFAGILDNPEEAAQLYAQRQATSMVPFSAGLRQIGNILDPTFRRPEGFVEQLKANLPGLSEQVPPRLTAFGQEAERPNPWSPFQFTTREQSSLDAALEQAGHEVGFTGRSIGGYSLDREQQQLYQQAAGQRVDKYMSELVSYPEWQDIPVERQAELLEDLQTALRRSVTGPVTEIIGSTEFKRLGPEQQRAVVTELLRELVPEPVR